jgi:hypothetical protein
MAARSRVRPGAGQGCPVSGGKDTGVKVERQPVDPRDKALGNAYRPGAEYFLFADGVKIGGTYWAGGNPVGRRWLSWGVAGLSGDHKTREDAEQEQVDAYREGVPQSALDRVARARDADSWCWK